MKPTWFRQRSSGPVGLGVRDSGTALELVARHHRHAHTENQSRQAENAEQQGDSREEANGPTVERGHLSCSCERLGAVGRLLECLSLIRC